MRYESFSVALVGSKLGTKLSRPCYAIIHCTWVPLLSSLDVHDLRAEIIMQPLTSPNLPGRRLLKSEA